MGLALGLLLSCLLVAAFIGGITIGARGITTTELRRMGISQDTVKQYHRAARLLTRIVRVTDLDGPGGADLVSPETRSLIDAWLADYRTNIEKV